MFSRLRHPLQARKTSRMVGKLKDVVSSESYSEEPLFIFTKGYIKAYCHSFLDGWGYHTIGSESTESTPIRMGRFTWRHR